MWGGELGKAGLRTNARMDQRAHKDGLMGELKTSAGIRRDGDAGYGDRPRRLITVGYGEVEAGAVSGMGEHKAGRELGALAALTEAVGDPDFVPVDSETPGAGGRGHDIGLIVGGAQNTLVLSGCLIG